MLGRSSRSVRGGCQNSSGSGATPGACAGAAATASSHTTKDRTKRCLMMVRPRGRGNGRCRCSSTGRRRKIRYNCSGWTETPDDCAVCNDCADYCSGQSRERQRAGESKPLADARGSDLAVAAVTCLATPPRVTLNVSGEDQFRVSRAMHFRILSMAALASLAVAVLVQPAAPQAGGDKKKDDQAKKEPDKTA